MRALLLLLSLLGAASAHAAELVEVWKSPSCGCCAGWIAHMKAAGFAVRVHDVAETGAARARLGVPARLGSCHTARVHGYALEGHVPASDVRRLLRDRPAGAAGLAVPGMPADAPGMDGRTGAPYDVVLFRSDGTASRWASYNRPHEGKP